MAFKLRTNDNPSPLRQVPKQTKIDLINKKLLEYSPYVNEEGVYNRDLKLENKHKKNLEKFVAKTPDSNFFEAPITIQNTGGNVKKNPNYKDVEAVVKERTERGYNTSSSVSGEDSNLFKENKTGGFSIQNKKRNYNPTKFDSDMYAKLMGEFGGVNIENGVMTGAETHEGTQTIDRKHYDRTKNKSDILDAKNNRTQAQFNKSNQYRYDRLQKNLSKYQNQKQ